MVLHFPFSSGILSTFAWFYGWSKEKRWAVRACVCGWGGGGGGEGGCCVI